MSCFGPLWNATLLNYAAHPNVDVFISRYWKEIKPHSYKIILNWDLPFGKGVVGVEQICEADFTTFFTTPDVIRTALALSLLLVAVNAALVRPDSCLKAFPLTIYSLSCFPWREVWGRFISNTRLWIVCSVSVNGYGVTKRVTSLTMKTCNKRGFIQMLVPDAHGSRTETASC